MMNFFETSNKDYESIVVASPYNKKKTTSLLNERCGGKVRPLKLSTMTAYDVELLTCYEEVNRVYDGDVISISNQSREDGLTNSWVLVP